MTRRCPSNRRYPFPFLKGVTTGASMRPTSRIDARTWPYFLPCRDWTEMVFVGNSSSTGSSTRLSSNPYLIVFPIALPVQQSRHMARDVVHADGFQLVCKMHVFQQLLERSRRVGQNLLDIVRLGQKPLFFLHSFFLIGDQLLRRYFGVFGLRRSDAFTVVFPTGDNPLHVNQLFA